VIADTFAGLDDPAPAAGMPIVQYPIAFTGSTVLDDWRPDGVRFFGRVSRASHGGADSERKEAVDELRATQPLSGGAPGPPRAPSGSGPDPAPRIAGDAANSTPAAV
jgi:hypothetical protein